MASETPETDPFLLMIEGKIAALRAFADSYRAAKAANTLGPANGDDLAGLLSGGINGPVNRSIPGGGPAFELPTGAFLNKNLPAAIKLLLSATKRKYWPKEAAAALLAGGFESTAKDFEKMVRGAMSRMNIETKELLRFDNGYGLAELYPESLRARLDAKDDSGSKKTKNKKKSKAKKAVGVDTAVKAKAATGEGHEAPPLKAVS